MLRILVFTLFVTVFHFQVRAAQDRALFWQVEGARGSTVYLLGSIHAADASFYPLRDAIDKAFDAADYLVVELNLDSNTIHEYERLIKLHGTYSGSYTIRDEISSATYRQLQSSLEALDVPLRSVEKQKPGLLVMTLSSLQFTRLGYSPLLGIDLHFIARAERKGKPVLELETIEEQLDIFLGFPDGDLLLRETLHSMGEAEQWMRDMVRYWKAGDDAALEALLFEATTAKYPAFAPVYDRLIDQRNVRMANRISGYLDAEGAYFVVVGAGHLVGDDGIPELLKRKGFRVQRK